MWIMCVSLWGDVVYVNSAVIIICSTCSSVFIIYECDNSFSMCVYVWAECHFVSREPTYDEFYAEDEYTINLDTLLYVTHISFH